jgi:predicted transcriptional regulator
MKRTTVFLDEEAQRELRLLAERENAPAASLLREAVDQYLTARRQKPRKPLRFLAAGRSGTRTTAARHEELLFRDLEPHGKARKRPRKPSRKS